MKENKEREVKRASEYESCMICTKRIDELKKENARLREQIMALSKMAIERGE